MTAVVPCGLDPAAMPERWRPHGAVAKSLSDAPWSAAEANDVAHALARGWDELTGLFARRPAAIHALGSDAVEALIDLSYAAGNMPLLRAASRDQASRVLAVLLEPFLPRDPATATCREFAGLLTLTNYAGWLWPPEDARLRKMVALTNAALAAGAGIAAAMGHDYRQRLAGKDTPTAEIYDLVMWSIMFTDAQLVPGLEVPAAARTLPPLLWRYLADYPLPRAHTYPSGAADRNFYHAAYLATHIAYIVTGYDRHPIYVADAPWLYDFLRENFYAVLEMGELDLVAEFVDLFRQYGCGENDDLQVRDGTRYLLRLFHAAGDHWMAHREPGQGDTVSAAEAVHKAWTGMAGIRVRQPEPAAPGTYGGVVRQWLGHPR